MSSIQSYSLTTLIENHPAQSLSPPVEPNVMKKPLLPAINVQETDLV